MNTATEPSDHGIDALLPVEIAQKAEALGVQKTGWKRRA